MSSGFFALLDDVAALVKVTAATLDDIPAQVAKTGTKVSGIVIDDTAVTPKYVVGLDPSRELSIIYNIAKRSLFNKLIFLAPAALILGFFAPWIIQPILMLGGAYLCFEGYEKVHSIFVHATDHDLHEAGDPVETITPEELEKIRIESAVRTDFILSAEIIAITYSTVAEKDIISQIIVMLSVAVAITVVVYGLVGLIVKADDLGVHLAKDKNSAFVKKFGRGLVLFMPHFLTVLSYIGTAAMLWVGAEIIVHGIPALHHGLEAITHAIGDIPILPWLTKVTLCALGGTVLGAVVAQTISPLQKLIARFKKA